MNLVTHKFFAENKRKINTIEQPKDILQRTEEYFHRKTVITHKLKDQKFNQTTDNKHMFWSVADYFCQLKNKGRNAYEREQGQKGIDMLALYRKRLEDVD